MPRFTKIPLDTFDNLQLDAGVILNEFDPESDTEPADDAILCATTGGVTVTATPEWTDMGEDVDNCPNNTKELLKLNGWTCTLAFTSITFSPAMVKLGLGAASITGNKVNISRDVVQENFDDVWWVGDLADGGMVAVHLSNALSREGLSITTSKNGKGQMALTLQGHTSINAQDEMPMEFYIAGGNA